jgi:DNA-binding LacI/PurR family transcriptional regulator
MIGLILPDITNPFFPLLARGVEDAGRRLGYSVFISNTDNELVMEQEYIHRMIGQQVAGIVLISSILNDDKFKELINFQTPIVLCDRLIMDTPFDTVTIDNYQAAYEVVSYLIDHGHRRICHIAGPSLNQTAEKRKLGYIDAMNSAGLQPFVCKGSFSYESGFQMMPGIIEQYQPTAVFATNDMVALGAIKAIMKQGLEVPKDISVFGCDDIPYSSISNPSLSTITNPAYEVGTKAVELLDNE